MDNKDNGSSSFVVLFESIKCPFTKGNIRTGFVDSLFQPPLELQQLVEATISSLVVKAKMNDKVFYDDISARLDDAFIEKGGILVLNFSKARYFHFAAMNSQLSKNPTGALKSFFMNESSITGLKTSKLPNLLGVNLSVILENKSIVLSIRSSRNFESSSLFASGVAGTVSIDEGDLSSEGKPDPFKCGVREAYEEIGLELKEQDIVFFGLGRNLVNLKPELYGEISVNMSEKDFMNSWKNAKDRWETEKIQIYDLTPTVISNLIRLKKWNPASVAATRASLIFRYPDANLTLNSRLKG